MGRWRNSRQCRIRIRPSRKNRIRIPNPGKKRQLQRGGRTKKTSTILNISRFINKNVYIKGQEQKQVMEKCKKSLIIVLHAFMEHNLWLKVIYSNTCRQWQYSVQHGAHFHNCHQLFIKIEASLLLPLPSTYTLHSHTPLTHSTHTLHSHPTLTPYTQTLHSHHTRTPYTHTLHAHPTLTPFTHTFTHNLH